MGNPTYSAERRMLTSVTMGYATKSHEEIFTQSAVKRIHESMDPKNAKLREARDSVNHPNSYPNMIAMDTTSSMRQIPLYLVRKGLPAIMEGIIKRGILDPQILFLGVGDTEVDHYPLQVGQFESGDVELDTWLTRTYIEGGGGSNPGESYHLAWYFAAYHTVTDAWEKRKIKGNLITIGDEPCLPNLPANVMNHLMDLNLQSGFSTEYLLKETQKKWNVYHIHAMEGNAGARSIGYWKELLGQNCIQADDQTKIAGIISDLIVNNAISSGVPVQTVGQQQQQGSDHQGTAPSTSEEPEIIL